MNKNSVLLINICLIFVIIICLNVIFNFFFFRIDLTEEKRYTISETSKIILKNLDDQIYVEVFLDGDLPSGFKRLQKSTKEFLDECRVYANSNLQYGFSDPLADNDTRIQQKYFAKLAERGLQPTNIFAKENGKQTEKLVFPGAIISYRGKELPINLLKSAAGVAPAEALNQSEEGIEYEMISAIKKLSSNAKNSIGFVQGHDELSPLETQDIFSTLSQNYSTDYINLLEINSLDNYKLLIIAKPKRQYSENEKLLLDQFIVKGGRVLLLIDKTSASLENLDQGKTTAVAFETNLEDLFFRIGIRYNPSIYQDAQCGMLPIVVGMQGNQPQTQLVPWMYNPVFTHFSTHPLVKNMSGVSGQFVGSIDTVKALGIKKTPLMFTSKYCKEIATPTEISLMEVRKQPNPSEFTMGEQPVAYLLEGKMKSMFTNRLSQQKIDSIQFKSIDSETKIIAISDGDIIRNEVSPNGKEIMPLGYDRYLRKKMANKDFILNCIDYLAGGEQLISLRAKELKLRPLDRQKAENERSKWQILNVALPLLLLLVFGVYQFQRRKIKYS